MAPSLNVPSETQSDAELIHLTQARLKNLEDEVGRIEAEYLTLQERVHVLKEQHTATSAFLTMLMGESANNGATPPVGPQLVAPRASRAARFGTPGVRTPERVRVKEAMKASFVAHNRDKSYGYLGINGYIRADLEAAGLKMPPKGSVSGLMAEIEAELK